jgi:hypothetical protein
VSACIGMIRVRRAASIASSRSVESIRSVDHLLAAENTREEFQIHEFLAYFGAERIGSGLAVELSTSWSRNGQEPARGPGSRTSTQPLAAPVLYLGAPTTRLVVKSADASSRDHRLRRMTRIGEGVAGRAAEHPSRKQVMHYSCARRHNRRNMTPEVNGR